MSADTSRTGSDGLAGVLVDVLGVEPTPWQMLGFAPAMPRPRALIGWATVGDELDESEGSTDG
jgi:hypothetical protein